VTRGEARCIAHDGRHLVAACQRFFKDYMADVAGGAEQNQFHRKVSIREGRWAKHARLHWFDKRPDPQLTVNYYLTMMQA
jgi:hypothetical protein